MRATVVFLVLFFSFWIVSLLRPKADKKELPAFDLVRILRIDSMSKERFDLSGIVLLSEKLKQRFKLQGEFLLVNDQTPIIYVGQTEGSSFIARPWLNLSKQPHIHAQHLTDIDSNSRSIFALDETDGDFFEIQMGQKRLEIKAFAGQSNGSEKSESRYGALGAFDNQIMVGRENAEHGLLNLQVSSPEAGARHFKREGSGTQTSIRIRGPLVYILDSANRCVWEEKLVDPTQPLRLSFRDLAESPDLRYGVFDSQHHPRPEWGTASALEIDGDTFYIGLDNNGEALVANPAETRPAVMVLKRRH